MGPLQGVKIIEIAGIGPGPFCGMMLSDMGAEIIRVDRIGGQPGLASGKDVLNRGRRTIAVDLRAPEGPGVILRLCEKVDALFEGFRPGVTERLGIGPKDCMARNPKLVYGRMTGWGQEGPLSHASGHDINYISLSGALHAIGRKGERPVPPLNLVGDFGGGGMLLAFGIVCGLVEAMKSGKGQVVDAAMVDGSAALMAMFFSFREMGMFFDERGTNLLDSGAHFYDSYETKDGKWISVGSIEPQFYAELVKRAGLDAERFAAQMDFSKWSGYKEEIIQVFKTKTRDEWCALMEGSDTCFAPVLSINEAPEHPHNKARKTFVTVDGVLQPAPAPRFDRTVPEIRHGFRLAGQDTLSVLSDYGFTKTEIEALQTKGVVAAA
ncbi:MAG: CoA transferase [Deltaproteobacteria bacterium]|nr:CoA transferase [Deltaproteobacteria bacterium]